MDSIDSFIACGTFEMRSTENIVDSHHTFHSHMKHVGVHLSTYANSPDMLTISTLPFRCVTYLSIIIQNPILIWICNKIMKLGL